MKQEYKDNWERLIDLPQSYEIDEEKSKKMLEKAIKRIESSKAVKDKGRKKRNR